MPEDSRTLFKSIFGWPYEPLSKGEPENPAWFRYPEKIEDFKRSGDYRG